jgi:uncharacterized protein involved in type VI secretion and phage assembly
MPVVIDELSGQASSEEQNKIYGVAIATVLNNVDTSGKGRVQLNLPWLPNYQPWARVAVLSAGNDRGTYFIPQIGDEVLVAFDQGDVREPYVIGSLWNSQDSPPASGPTDPIAKRIIKTPLGHVMEFDDLQQSIKVTTTTQQTLTMDASGIKIATTGDAASIQMDTSGSITIQGSVSVTIKGATISLEGASISIKADADLSIQSGGTCQIQGSLVTIN